MQCLILFDTDLPREWWFQAQGALGIPYVSNDTQAASARSLTQLSRCYDELAEDLDTLKDLRGRYIVLPNVSQGGQHTVVRNGAHQRFKEMPYIGGYLDAAQTIDTCNHTHKQRLSGQDQTWGNKVIYPIPTSDARDHGYPNLGSNNTWIKLSLPSAESIRQACLAWQSRIRIEEPAYPNVVIRSMTVRGTSPLDAVSLSFSPELNSIIGGRGSGKSTLLEYLAFGIGRGCHDLPAKDYSGKERLVRLIKDTLISENADVEVRIEIDGAAFAITRSAVSGYHPVLTYPNGNKETISEKEVRALIPGVAYSQGELSELGSANTNTKLTDLLAFVDPTYKYEADSAEKKILDVQSALDGAYRKLVQLWTATAERTRTENRVNAIKARIIALNATLPKLDQVDQTTLNKHARLLELSQDVARISHDISDIGQRIQEIVQLARKMTPISDNEDTTFESFAKAANALVGVVTPQIETLASAFGRENNKLETASDTWTKYLAAHQSTRDEVLKRMGVQKTAAKQIADLQGNISSEMAKLQEIDRRIVALYDPMAVIASERAALKTAVKDQTEQLRTFGAQIEEQSDNTILVRVDDIGDLTEVYTALEILATRTRSHEAVRIRKFEELSSRSDAWKVLDNIVSEAARAVFWRISGADAESTPRIDTINELLSEGDTAGKAFLGQVDIDRLAVVAKAVPRPRISFMYKADGREITFDKASEGQRAAALLMMLIKQGGGPLLVDQPESDLDNSVVIKVVSLLHGMKHRRQVVFATHNANLVVNGASEFVIAMANNESGRRVVHCSGAIDDPVINRCIAQTMEGGEQAFRDRHRKYGF